MTENKEEGKEKVADEVERWLNEEEDVQKKEEEKSEEETTEKEKKIEEIEEENESENLPIAEPSSEEKDSDEEAFAQTPVIEKRTQQQAPPDLSKKREVTVTVIRSEKKEEEPEPKQVSDEIVAPTKIFALRTTANREDQVMSFVSSNAERKGINIYSVIRPHGMRGYIFIEAPTKNDAEQSAYGIPYARGILPKEIEYKEIEHMLEQVKKEVNIQKGDIAEVISGPFKREKCKITRIDKVKEEVVVELLEAAVPIPITVKLDAVKVIRRDSEEGE